MTRKHFSTITCIPSHPPFLPHPPHAPSPTPSTCIPPSLCPRLKTNPSTDHFRYCVILQVIHAPDEVWGRDYIPPTLSHPPPASLPPSHPHNVFSRCSAHRRASLFSTSSTSSPIMASSSIRSISVFRESGMVGGREGGAASHKNGQVTHLPEVLYC